MQIHELRIFDGTDDGSNGKSWRGNNSFRVEPRMTRILRIVSSLLLVILKSGQTLEFIDQRIQFAQCPGHFFKSQMLRVRRVGTIQIWSEARGDGQGTRPPNLSAVSR